jgi:cobalt-zinc-cadmium efflux system outer membrane protein
MRAGAALAAFVLVAGCASTGERRARDRFDQLEQDLYGGVRMEASHGRAAGGTPGAPADTSVAPGAARAGRAGPEGGRRFELPVLDENAGLQDYLAYAALRNAGLEAAFYQWKAALEKVPQARALPDPRFNYGYFIREVETRVGPQRQRFGIAQTFPWFGKLALRGDVALQASEAARERYEWRKLGLFYRVKKAFYEYYYLGRAAEITTENRELLRYWEKVARVRYKTATARHPDVIKAQVELGKLDDRLRTIERSLDPVRAELNAALDRPPDAPLPVPRSVPDETEPGVTDEELFGWMRERNPRLRSLAFEIARQEKRIDLARKNFFPDLTLGLDYVQTDGALMSGVPDDGKDPLMAMLSINVPLWWGKYRAEEKEARAQARAARRTLAQEENDLETGLERALFNLNDAARKIDLFRDTLIPKGKQSLKATEAAYRTGEMDFLNLVDAQRLLLEFQLSYERARADHGKSLAEVEMLVGREIPPGPEEMEP